MTRLLIGDERRMKASIEQRKTRRQDARLGLNAADEHPSDAETTQVIDRLHRRQVSVLDKQPVCGDETFVVGGWMPVQLALKRDFRLDVALHRCHGRHQWQQSSNSGDQARRWCEAPLNVNDHQCLFHTLCASIFWT